LLQWRSHWHTAELADLSEVCMLSTAIGGIFCILDEGLLFVGAYSSFFIFA